MQTMVKRILGVASILCLGTVGAPDLAAQGVGVAAHVGSLGFGADVAVSVTRLGKSSVAVPLPPTNLIIE